MTFIKYCEKKYNIANGSSTIQLGTFQHYRELDSRFVIADPGEAISGFSLTQNNIFILNEEQADVMSASVIKGAVEFHAGYHNVKTTFPNCYIFCFTQYDKADNPSLDKAREFDPKYDSWYRITDLKGFINNLALLLGNNKLLIDLDDNSIRQVSRLPSIETSVFEIHPRHRGVTYISARSKKISDSSGISSRQEREEEVWNSIFCKEKRDESQKEYRIVFILKYPKIGILGVKKKPLILPISQNDFFSRVCVIN